MKKEKFIFVFILGVLSLYFSYEILISSVFDSVEIKKNLKNLSSTQIIQDTRGAETLSSSRIPKLKFYSSDEFSGLLMKVYSDIPTIDDLRRLSPEDAHNYPNSLIETGRNLGLIVELVKNKKELLNEAIGFYSKCSKRDRFPSSVRAICLSNLMKFSKDSDFRPDLSLYPRRVLEMVKILENAFT